MDISVSSLKGLLGSESGSNWIKFMDYVADELPFLSSAGAPPKAQVQASIIGQEGCLTWEQFVKERLNWKYSNWKSWKRAYLLVQRHPYLRELGLTASEINTMNPKDAVFPDSIEAYHAQKSEKKAEFERKRQESLKAVTFDLSKARDEVSSLKLKISQLEKDLELEKNRGIVSPVRQKPSKALLVTSILINVLLISYVAQGLF